MMYFNFENGFESFKMLFGKRETNNGKTVRQNGILLAFLKTEFKRKNYDALRVSSMSALYDYILQNIYLSSASHNVCLKWGGRTLYANSTDYHTDERQGSCEDYDSKSIRYARNDNGRVFKMKAGKFMRHLLMNNPITSGICEQAMNYVCETFASEWSSYMESENPENYRLVVDDDFEKIYDSCYMEGNFHSCMTNEHQHSFYSNAVDASAASLWKDDMMVARCVIFDEVTVEGENKVIRLAERQYSSDGNDDMKRILVNRLIAGGYIDGYKKVGAGCHDSRAFLLNDGTSIEQKTLSIRCYLDTGDTLSYQDSFKYYDLDKFIAYNSESRYHSHELDVTDSTFEVGEWDSYHERYCDDVTTVYVWNDCEECYDEETCDVYDVDDFYQIDGELYNEAYYCAWWGEKIPKDCSIYCEEMDDYLPEGSYDEILKEWKEKNWEWDELNKEYVRETVTAYVWNKEEAEYEEKFVGEDYVFEYFFEYDGEYYDKVSESGVPYTMELCEAV